MSQSFARAASGRVVVYGFLPALILLAATAALGVRAGVRLDVFTRDPLVVAGGAPYFGVLSNLGVLLWCTAACVCFLTRAALGPSRHGTFLLCSGALTAMLMFDDLFMLHEKVFPDGLGISERRVLAGYGAIAFAYAAVFARTIFTTRWHTLPLTAGCFAASVAIDAGWPVRGTIFAEDAAKFLGIAGWCAYLCSTCVSAIRVPLLAAQVRELYDAAAALRAEQFNREAIAMATELAELADSGRGTALPDDAPHHAPDLQRTRYASPTLSS